MDFLNRFELQVGKEAINKLNNFHIALFGLGGVGSFCAEILARSGVGQLSVIDKDKIDLTNINRQIFALQSTINQDKVQVCKERLLDINPNIKVNCHQIDFCHQTDALDLKEFDYVIDAIDDTEAKFELIKRSKENNVKVISCMGTGNKLNPLLLKIDDISKSYACPLAKIMRKKLKNANIEEVKCLFSTEKPIDTTNTTISSNAFVPSVAGILLAREVILDLIN